MNQQRMQRGQVLILIILAIAAIFGFAALAIDIGRTYSERRRAQSAADAAAYAAAFASTQSKDYREAGRNSVRLNGFNDSNMGPITDDPTGWMNVEVYNPPISGKYSTATETIDPDEYFQVIIYQRIKPAFAQFVYQGPLEFTVEAIARGTPTRSFADGASIVATCTDCCDAIKVHGTADIRIIGGNIVSNSKNRSDVEGCDAAWRTGSPCISLDDGTFITGGTLDPGGSTCKNVDGVVQPGITGNIEQRSTNLWASADPGMPGCEEIGGMPVVNTSNYANVGTTPGDPLVLSPGIYTNGISISGVKSVVSLQPGMYCLDGDLEVKSGSLIGTGVMLVMRNNSSININTGQPVVLSAPGKGLPSPYDCIADNTIYAGYCWSGFLVYMPYSNTGIIHFAGGNSTSYTGTVFAPGPAKPASKTKCTVVGGADNLGLNASLICYTVDIGGTGVVNIEYYNDASAQNPAIVEMSK